MTFSADDFARALEEQHDYTFQVGSVVRGTVVNFDSEGAAVDIGGKSSALLPVEEVTVKRVSNLADVIDIGDERDFLIIRDQDADGQVLLSLRRLELKKLWEKLSAMQEESATVEVKVTGTNKGGVTVDVEGLRGFVPRSHLSQKVEDLETLVGSKLTVGFLEANPATNKLVLSQRIAARTQVMTQLELGQLISGTVVNLKPFGAFIEFNGITGLLHINQISKSYVDSLSTIFQLGQAIKAVVVDLDAARNRISLSTKVLEKYPGEMLKDLETVMAEAESRTQDISRILAESEN
ncbi:S1 RNA-binding domain-containing protein [Pseudanabaena sp. FACHB-2040]|uniref:S1 RNA-binding domain-containing protein n=1 Tax=Pseudanabaena sp. FACHB-2040 TaxID=2692859 RepID=UPI0016837937|nr:S1 RNA-binding domain-containing protein [Pseudanabaena sp. FACHB-2040]MBD0267990.1 S1 RNA-binding domain-containing protein [Cyanobacteria bacterium Co-bin8]MBD2260285.1 S1 RNA-binding domain-containing protein [Pseudanabaena sp. FACHB-2040]